MTKKVGSETLQSTHVDMSKILSLFLLFRKNKQGNIDITTTVSPFDVSHGIPLLPREATPTDGTEGLTNFRVHGFPEKQTLSGWFPKINDNGNTSWGIRISERNQSLLLFIALNLIVLTFNLALVIYTNLNYPSRNGVGLIFAGDCDEVNKLDGYCHLLINILSTGMLTASNHCTQLLAAPTRADVDRAHRDKTWLDIGVPNLRNFRYIGGWRRLVCVLLVFCSLPIHLMYNSAVFRSLASNDYTIVVVKDSFITGKSWDLSTAEQNRMGDPSWDEQRVNPNQDYHTIISDIQHAVLEDQYEKMNISTCFSLYDDYWAPQGNGVILVKNESVQTDNDSLLMYVSVVPRWDDWAKNMWAVSNGTRQFSALSPPQPVTEWFLGPPRYEASRCLVQPPILDKDRCRFEYSTHVMYTVCILNFIMLFIMVYIWILRVFKHRSKNSRAEEHIETCRIAPLDVILSTLGDAIASFMRQPVGTTKNMCLATKYDFLGRRTCANPFIKKPPQRHDNPRQWKKEPKRWMSAPSLRQWLCLLFMYFMYILLLSLLLYRVIVSFKHRSIPTNLSNFWNLGFGALTPLAYLVVDLPREDPAGLLYTVIVVNLPQLFFSATYTIYSAVLSTFLVQYEFSLMHSSSKRKPLRVSEPVGIQRSSYFISIPLRYGIPLILSSGVIHWLISQSFFLARVTALNTNGSQDYDHSFSTLGFSPIAIIITMLVLFAHLVVLILLGCRKYEGITRMVSTNSLAISAACHTLTKDRDDGYLFPVQWGVVEIKDGIGHCTFTSASSYSIREPKEGMTYQ
ncbi:hypothetical protein F5B20DRAFT_542097 [Whalleya microplaca]|nr:hypothetical protein F5B20DRAFT_542097 [Whalleya microplaca]